MLVHMFLSNPRPKISTITTATECLVAWFNGSPTVGLYFKYIYISGLNNWTLHCALCLPLRTMLHQTVVIRMLQASFRLEGGVHRLAGEPEKVILCSAIEVAAHLLLWEHITISIVTRYLLKLVYILRLMHKCYLKQQGIKMIHCLDSSWLVTWHTYTQ